MRVPEDRAPADEQAVASKGEGEYRARADEFLEELSGAFERAAAGTEAPEDRALSGDPVAASAGDGEYDADRILEDLRAGFERLEAEAEMPATGRPTPPGPDRAGTSRTAAWEGEEPAPPAPRVRFARARRFMGADRAMAQHRRVLGEGYRLLRHNPGAPVLVFGTVIVAAASRPLAVHHHASLASLVSWILGALVVLVYVLRTRMLAGLAVDLAAARRTLASGIIPPAYDSRFGRRVALPLARRCLRVRVDAGAGPPRAGG